MKKIISILGGFALSLAFAGTVYAATPQNAVFDSSTGTIHLSAGASIADAVAAPDDEQFIQMGAGSTITLKFPDDYVAAPDGTIAPDLQINIYDALFPASAPAWACR